MIPGFHGFDLIVILLIALLIFGPKKLPEMGASIGKSIKEFRKGMNELTTPKEDEPAQPISSKDMSKLSPGYVAYDGEAAPKTASSEASHAEIPAE